MAALPLGHFRLAPEAQPRGPETAEPQSGAPQPPALSCGPDGPALAGAPLLRKTDAGFAPPPRDELAALTLAAYGEIPDLQRLTRGLATTAAALNHGDLPLAMTAAVHLQLPDVTAEGATRLAAVAEYLAKRAAAEPAEAAPEPTAPSPANGRFLERSPKRQQRTSAPSPKPDRHSTACIDSARPFLDIERGWLDVRIVGRALR